MPAEKRQDFVSEARMYNTDRQLNGFSTNVPVDEWWATVNTEQYPTLTTAAKGLLRCFHGPMVEGSFSIMGDLLDEGKARMDMETYAALQLVKFSGC